MPSAIKSRRLRVFSAGAVAPPLQKAVSKFEKKSGTGCDVRVAKPSILLAEIESGKQGDVISTGAEYVLDDAEDNGTIMKGSRRSLGFRRSAIIVPSGNPAGIKSLDDLCQKGVQIGIATDGCLRGVWDDVASKARLTDQIRRNITHHADSCGSVMALINTKKVDAIFGWSAFQFIWPDTCQAVELPRDLQVFRSTVAAVVTYTRDAKLAGDLVEYLASSDAREIYTSYGWIRQ